MSLPLFDRFLAPADAAAPFDDIALIQAMFDFEAGLARAQAAAGMIPAASAGAIASVCKAELYDLDALAAASTRAGSLAIPLVKELTHTVSLYSAEASAVVHKGSTSQDVQDTAMALCTRRSLDALDAVLARLIASLLDLAEQHADTPVLARTLMQPAQVTSFGLKVLNWTAPLVRCRTRLRDAASRGLALQLGGAIGTQAGLGLHAGAVSRHMADALGLALPASPWHTQRDEWLRVATEAGVLAGCLGKIGTDLALMAQVEVGELSEPAAPGRGGSSAMPHKRNPVGALVALAVAQRTPHRVAALLGAMGQQHERGLGTWQAELAEWPGLFIGVHASALALADVFAAPDVHPDRMRRNIDALHGLVFAEPAAALLAPVLGKAGAHTLLEQLSGDAARHGHPLEDLMLAAVQADPALRKAVDAAAVKRVFDPQVALAAARRQFDERLPALRAA
jgi:3-carboxy-cis,cis-muconate cycloisomerase